MKRQKVGKMATCRIEDCENVISRKQLCNMHYSRWYRHGDPLVARRWTRNGDQCHANGCTKKSITRNLCDKHYSRFKRTGDPLGFRPRRPTTMRSKKHGMTYTRIYNIWCGMVQRCTNP